MVYSVRMFIITTVTMHIL